MYITLRLLCNVYYLLLTSRVESSLIEHLSQKIRKLHHARTVLHRSYGNEGCYRSWGNGEGKIVSSGAWQTNADHNCTVRYGWNIQCLVLNGCWARYDNRSPGSKGPYLVAILTLHPKDNLVTTILVSQSIGQYYKWSRSPQWTRHDHMLRFLLLFLSLLYLTKIILILISELVLGFNSRDELRMLCFISAKGRRTRQRLRIT